MTEEKDYLLQVKIKNAPMLRAMKRRGYATAADLYRACGVSQSEIGGYLNLKLAAFQKNGELSPGIVKIAVCLGVEPSHIFPPQHFESPLEKNRAEVEISFEEVGHFLQAGRSPEELLEHEDLSNLLASAVNTLPVRQRKIILGRLEDKSYREVGIGGGQYGDNVTPETIRQQEARALRSLRKILTTKENRHLIPAEYLK